MGAAGIPSHVMGLGEGGDQLFGRRKDPWLRTMATGSSLPVYTPATLCILWAEIAAACSPWVREKMASMPNRSLSRSRAAKW